jgi:hypothetical protein
MEIDPTLFGLWKTAVTGFTFAARTVFGALLVLAIITIPVYFVIWLFRIFYGIFFVCVPEGYQAVVERRGKYNRVLAAGVHFMWPFMENFRSPSKSIMAVSSARTGFSAPPLSPLHTENAAASTEKEKLETAAVAVQSKKKMSAEEFAQKTFFDVRKQVIQIAPVTLTFLHQERTVQFKTDLYVVFRFTDTHALCYNFNNIDDILHYAVISVTASLRWTWRHNSQKADFEHKIVELLHRDLAHSGIFIESVCTSSYITMPSSSARSKETEPEVE